MKTYWRRVFVWDLERQEWRVASDGQISAINAFDCVFGGASWCSQPQPYVYEQWWSFIPDTIGTGSGSWSYLGGRVNWGTNVGVD